MKNIFKGLSILALAGLLLMLVATPPGQVFAGGGDDGSGKQINPPPFDFSDSFYQENGIDLSVLNSSDSQRFGLFRQTGPPAPPGKLNWVIDDSNTSPVRNNVRILATTGAYKDDTGSPDQFFSIIAFAKCGEPKGTACTNGRNFFTAVPNKRGITMEEIVGVPNNPLPGCSAGQPFDPKTCSSNFEAYAALKQVVNGVIAPSPCGTMGDGLQPCFPVTSIETSHLRQDWRLSTNRARVDNSASFAYFGDNLLGMWVITYHWYTKFAVGGRPDQRNPTATCQTVLAAAGQQNGLSLDGTPIIHSGEELHFLEGVASHPEFGLPLSAMPPTTAPCAQESNQDAGGADNGTVWLVCPSIPDPTRGGIAKDAFLDVVRRIDGSPLDPRITANFQCLQETGQFCQTTTKDRGNHEHTRSQRN
jgi:hypothetical protein